MEIACTAEGAETKELSAVSEAWAVALAFFALLAAAIILGVWVGKGTQK